MKVLIATDDTAFDNGLTDFLKIKYWADNVEFAILFVLEPLLIGSYLSLLPSTILEEMKAKMKERGQDCIKEISGLLRASYPDSVIKEHIIEGFPKEEILDFASEFKADMIVVGSHGRKGFNKLLLGSVSQAVCTLAPCPVLVIRPANQ